MGVKTGLGLKSAQFLFRGITFGCSVVVLGIFGYFLASMHSHGLHIPTWVRAVEGLAGAATLYTLIGLLLLWCLAGIMAASMVAILLDLCFFGCFIYIASKNRHGASRTCKGTNIETPYGTGNSANTVSDNGHGGSITLPTYRTACRLETAVLAVSCIAIILLLLSALTECMLARNHKREKKYGPGPNNDYTSGAGNRRRKGPFGRRRKGAEAIGDDVAADTTEKPPNTYGNNPTSMYGNTTNNGVTNGVTNGATTAAQNY